MSRMRLSAKARRMVAAFLIDRADQYDAKSPCWVALADAAHGVMDGDLEQRVSEGEFDDPRLMKRVNKWRRVPAPSPQDEQGE